MVNQVILVGRINSEPIKKDNYAIVTVAISRNYKNVNGKYETDLIDVMVRGQIASTTTEYCRKGYIIGIKGMVQSEYFNENRVMRIIAERVTFLSSKKDD